jgi:two-component system, NtrC family, nitrogen regulation response regulator NtrX
MQSHLTFCKTKPQIKCYDAFMQQKILILDANRPSVEALRKALKFQGYEVITAYTALEGQKRLLEKLFHLVLVDENFVAKSGQNFLGFLRRKFPGLPGIILIRQGLALNVEEGLDKSGFQLISRSAGPGPLLESIRKLFSHEAAEIPDSDCRVEKNKPFQLLGESPSILYLRETLRTLAETSAPVLLRGETGTGKELAARFLHAHSLRSQNNFIAVNCAALTESLLESELFGHEKGAFTGAHRQKLGKFEYAGSGTLFLDEIGEISPPLQAKMLRVLDDRKFERVGGNKTIDVQCRVIAASNIDFAQAMEAGRFREDLYYRLNVVSIDLPPLRDRALDIPLLVRHFLIEKSRRHNKPVAEISPEALTKLCQYRWPGNVRELENMIEQAVILAKGDVIDRLPLPGQKVAPVSANVEAGDLKDLTQLTLKEYTSDILKESEARYFDALLTRYNGHISRTAEAAGIDRKTFYRKIKQCGIDPKKYKLRK